ncbi:unnamed protein product [Lactuca virosa]|uniref:Gelsolin-like domain-containing protein n=1 Tax=Lactuca virosa TaxID=75947 RepID=A0AAU9NQC8_9ASTR|nr:unnamed protein product [Lactuca virosa]
MSTLAFKENCSSFLFSLSPQDFFTSACYEQFLLLMVRYSTKVFIWIGGTSSGEQHLGNSTNIELQPRMLCFVTRLPDGSLMEITNVYPSYAIYDYPKDLFECVKSDKPYVWPTK